MLFTPEIDLGYELRLRVAMAMSGKFWPIHTSLLMDTYGSLSAALEEEPKVFSALRGMRGKREKWLELIDSDAVEKEISDCQEQGVRLLMPEEGDYPAILKEIPDPPMLLWLRGQIEEADQRALAIVGSRSASSYALHQTRIFVDGLVREGVTIISGLARGIDTEAHKRALDKGGRTIAVLGSGFQALYPKENRDLAEKVCESGALISEFPLATKALPNNFPRRNRIVSGLSQGVLVVQAGERSGSLITARLANEQNREVFALPSRIDGDDNIGGLKLIRDAGAGLVVSPNDIFAALPAFGGVSEEHSAKSSKPKTHVLENKEEEKICALLNHVDAVNVEELIASTNLSAAQIGSTLMMLEMRGVVKQLPGSNYLLCD